MSLGPGRARRAFEAGQTAEMHAPASLQCSVLLLAVLPFICTSMCAYLFVHECKCQRKDHADQSTWRETCRCADTAGPGRIRLLTPFLFQIPCLFLSHFPSLLPCPLPFFSSYYSSLLLEMEPRTLSMLGKSSTTELQVHPLTLWYTEKSRSREPEGLVQDHRARVWHLHMTQFVRKPEDLSSVSNTYTIARRGGSYLSPQHWCTESEIVKSLELQFSE